MKGKTAGKNDMMIKDSCLSGMLDGSAENPEARGGSSLGLAQN